MASGRNTAAIRLALVGEPEPAQPTADDKTAFNAVIQRQPLEDIFEPRPNPVVDVNNTAVARAFWNVVQNAAPVMAAQDKKAAPSLGKN